MNFNITNDKIYIRLYYKSLQIKVSTGIKVSPNTWNNKKQRLKPSAASSREINNRLSQIESNIIEHININNPAPKELREFIKGIFSHKSDLLHDKYKQLIKIKTKENHSESYIRHLNTNCRLLFECDPDISIIDINNKFLKKFEEYLHSLNYVDHTVHKQLNMLNNALSQMLKYDLINNKIKLSIPKLNYQPDVVALNVNELKAIENLECKGHINTIKQMFLFQIYTALRVSDFMNLKPNQINIEDNELHIRQIKTKQVVKIPLHSKLLNIINYYINKKLIFVSLKSYRLGIKTLCQRAGIDSDVLKVEFRNKKRYEIVKPKYEFISPHTARRTFATIMHNQGVPDSKIMAITGHKDHKSFRQYIRVTDSDAMKTIKDTWDSL